jgi:hypothetical protein
VLELWEVARVDVVGCAVAQFGSAFETGGFGCFWVDHETSTLVGSYAASDGAAEGLPEVCKKIVTKNLALQEALEAVNKVLGAECSNKPSRGERQHS